MAAPTISNDLVDLALAESYSTDNSGVGGAWSVFGGSGGSSVGTGIDFAIQGTNAIDMKITSSNGRRGPVFGPNTARSLGTDEMFFVWTFVATPGILTSANFPAGNSAIGLALFAGNSINNNYVHYSVRNPGDYGEKGRVGECFAWIPDGLSGSNETIESAGSPSAPWDFIGATAEFSANSKGSNFAVDAIRQGTGVYCTDGETANPITFDAIDSNNNLSSRRYGVLINVSGTSYECQGAIAIGIDNTGTSSTATCVFTDLIGSAITYRRVIGNPTNTPNKKNKFIVGGSSTTATLTNVTFLQVNSNSADGSAQIIVKDAAVANFTSCNFSDIGAFDLTSSSACSFTSCGFRGLKTGDTLTGVHSVVDANNNFTFTTCSFDGGGERNGFAGTSLLGADLAKIDNCTFTGSTVTAGNTGHAVDAGTISSAATIVWNSTANTGTAAGEFAASDGSTGHEVIRVNYTDTSNPLVISVQGGTTPSIMNTGAGTVNVVTGQVDVTVNVVDPSGADIDGARVYVEAAAGGPLAVGTVIINKLLTVNGTVTSTIGLSSDQPVTGNIRKASGAPFYKAADVAGGTVVSATTGLTLNVQMISDE